MSDEVKLVRLDSKGRTEGARLADVFPDWNEGQECFMMLSPHDDDVVLGAGLLIELARRENVPVYIGVVTDGSMGYCSIEEKDSISQIRREETFECYQGLGVPRENVVWMSFPDCRLNNYCGRSPVAEDLPYAIAGHAGLQNSFTHYIRNIKPTRCILPTSTDVHPDHWIVSEEFLISLFHANGGIWPELGQALPQIPAVYEMAVYCDFPSPPTIRVAVSDEMLEKKLNAIGAYKSQKQILSLIENVRSGGAQEFFRDVEFKLYKPNFYEDMFK